MSRSYLAWLILFGAGLLECGWAIGLKYTNGFSRLVPSVLTVVAMAGSFAGLTYALKTLPTGSAYAVWTGIGAAATAALGIVLFDEPATLVRLAGIAFVIAGIAAIRLGG